jgi:hypothetical protein
MVTGASRPREDRTRREAVRRLDASVGAAAAAISGEQTRPHPSTARGSGWIGSSLRGRGQRQAAGAQRSDSRCPIRARQVPEPSPACPPGTDHRIADPPARRVRISAASSSGSAIARPARRSGTVTRSVPHLCRDPGGAPPGCTLEPKAQEPVTKKGRSHHVRPPFRI